MLYPYRPSAVKNRQRFNFGVLYPEAYSRRAGRRRACEMQTECLVAGRRRRPRSRSTVRFLHLVARPPSTPGEPAVAGGGSSATSTVPVAAVARAGRASLAASVELPRRSRSRARRSRAGAPVARGPARSRPRRRDRGRRRGRPASGVYVVTVRVANRTDRAPSRRRSATSVLLRSPGLGPHHPPRRGGEFVSLLDPPAELREAAAACRNVGTWPVLAGDDGRRDTMLSSPIILYDYPADRPREPRRLLRRHRDRRDPHAPDPDADRRREARDGASRDERARQLLERTEALAAEQLMRLHGVMRDSARWRGAVNEQDWRLLDDRPRSRSSAIGGWPRQGDRVRLRPARRGRRVRPGARRQDRHGRGHRAGLRGQLPRRGGARRRPRRRPRPAAPAGPPLLLHARGGRAAAAGRRRVAAARHAGPSWSPASATSSSATTGSASRWPSGWRRGRCPPGCPSCDYGIRGLRPGVRARGAARTTRSWWMPARGASAPGTLYVHRARSGRAGGADGDAGDPRRARHEPGERAAPGPLARRRRSGRSSWSGASRRHWAARRGTWA